MLFCARKRRHAARFLDVRHGGRARPSRLPRRRSRYIHSAGRRPAPAAGIAGAAAPVAAGCRGAGARPAAAPGLRRAVLCLVNHALATAASAAARRTPARPRRTRHAADMARHDYFGHVSRSGAARSPRPRRGLARRRRRGHRLGLRRAATPARHVAAWMPAAAPRDHHGSRQRRGHRLQAPRRLRRPCLLGRRRRLAEQAAFHAAGDRHELAGDVAGGARPSTARPPSARRPRRARPCAAASWRSRARRAHRSATPRSSATRSSRARQR